MKRPSVLLFSAFAVAILVVAGCTQAAPTPTAAPARRQLSQPKHQHPLRHQPDQAGCHSADGSSAYRRASEEGGLAREGQDHHDDQPFAAGGGVDIFARLLAPYMERELGIPVQVVNRAGAATQVGLTELVAAKPDGYTLGVTSTMTTVLVYLDPEKKATFSRKSFQPIAVGAIDPWDLPSPPRARIRRRRI